MSPMTRLLTPTLFAAVFAAGSVHAAPKAETFPLGMSASTGAVCQAVRDYDDPLSDHGGQ